MFKKYIGPVEKQETVDEENTPISCVKYEISLIKKISIFPVYGEILEENRILFFTKFIANVVVTVLFVASILLNIIVNFENTAELIETLYFGLTETTFFIKLINMHLRYKTFKSLEAYLVDPLFTKYKNAQQLYITQAIRVVRIFGHLFRGCVSITIVFFIVFPFLDQRLLVIPSYFPFSVEKYHFWFYLFQLWGIMINGYAHTSLDCIVTGMITMGSAQFEILKDNLRNVDKEMQMSDEEILSKNVEELHLQEDIVLGKLKSYVQHHVQIIEYAFGIENMFSFVQFVQFLASSIIICVTGFQIIVTPITDLKFITLILYFSCNLIQVSMCCWFGHDIMTKSEGVSDACYMSKWYNCGTRVGRTLFIIMERSKRPITLTAGKFFDLTLQTLMQVLKTSYSYLALLRRMNEIERL